MKLINYSGLLLALFTLALFSCEKEGISPAEDSALDKHGKGELLTTCNISGDASVAPGSSGQYTYTADFSPSSINWSVTSGNITITSGQFSSTVTLQFGSNFNGGTINAYGSGANDVVCSDNFTISKKYVACTPPTNVIISQTDGECPGEIFTFTADPNGSSDSGTYQWSASHGASVISGQGSSTVRIASPSSGGFSVSVDHVNNCQGTEVSGFTLAQFDSGCGGGFGF